MYRYLRPVFATILLISSWLPLTSQTSMPAKPEISESRKGVRISTDVIAIALPAATLTGILVTRDWTGLKQGALTAVTTLGVTELLKFSIHKRRPDYSDNRSFPSGHTAITFADAAFLQRRYGWKIGAPAYALAAYVGWGRTFAKKHDWWDVLAGVVIGAGSAYIYTRPLPDKSTLTISPVSDGQNLGFTALYTF